MSINILLLTITLLINLILGVMVLVQDRKRAISRTFSGFVLMIAAWTGSVAMQIISPAEFWSKTSLILFSFLVSFLLVFVQFFQPRVIWKNKYLLFFAPSVIFILFSHQAPEFSVFANPKNLSLPHALLSLYFISYTLAAIYVLIKRLRQATGIYRNQTRYILSGISFFSLTALVTNAVLPWFAINEYEAIGPISSIIMVGAITYSILRYRFLELKLVIEASLSYGLSILITLLISVLLKSGFNHLNLTGDLIDWAVIIISLLIFPGIKKGLTLIIQSINRPTFNFTNSLKNLAENLTRLVNLEEIIRVINDTVANSLAVEFAATTIFEKKGLHIYSSRPYPENLSHTIREVLILRYLNDFKCPLVAPEIQLVTESRGQESFLGKVALLVAKCPVEIYLPLLQQNKLIGVITLGKKISGEAFSKREVELLETLAFQASIAIANGKLYQEINDLNANLKNKVNEQTKHLNRLLKIKQEFLQITSHQLRTPTTIVKGMLSMILEGSLDHDEIKKRQYIEQAYASAVNLERIIREILDASDMAAGKLMMSFESLDLTDLLQKLIAERSHLAKTKNLNLRLVATPDHQSLVSADRLKIREALANLIDNAIHYTAKGEVCVSLESSQDNRWISVCVKDTGIGIKPEEKKRIFKKFIRNDRSTMMNPNGSGLGLYLVKQIIDAHHGQIEVDSEGENLGTVFKVSIPTAKLI